MRRILARLIVIILLCAPAAWQAQPLRAQQGPQMAIESVIRSQLDAFMAGHVVADFGHASPTIKGIFGTAETFGAMVQRGYPMVWRHSDVRFAELREVAGQLYQGVILTDLAGKLHLLEYQMLQTDMGWQINAVQDLQMPQLGV